VKKIINSIFGIFSLKLIKVNAANSGSGTLSYISANETILNAQKEGLSVCDYVEKIWNQKGALLAS
jgi:hypothetical protein